MKAVLFMGKDRLEVADVDTPVPGPGEALIRVRYASVCGTDLSILAGKHPRATPPLIMGHEIAGEIVEIRERARDDLHEGDAVVIEPLIFCGECVACRSGLSHVCQQLRLYGIDAPESGQFCEKDAKQYRCGQQAPSALSDKLGRATISCEKRDIDRFCSFSSGLNSPNAQN